MAKKKTDEETIRRGIDELRAGGLEVDEPSPALVGALKDRFGRNRRTDLAVAFLLGRIADRSAAEALADLEPRAGDKEVRKEIRRSLFKLTQRGIELPELPAEPVRPAGMARPAIEMEAYMSSVDGGGGRLLWIVRPQPGEGLQLIQAMVADRQGLVRFGGARIRRKELRAMMRDMQERHGARMIPVPWEYADRVMFAAYEKARESGRTGMEDFSRLRAIVNPGKPVEREHPAYSRLAVEDVRSGPWREQSRRLLDEPEFRYWILDADWMEPFLEQFQEAQTSRLVLNQAQREERLAGIVRDATRAIAAGESGGVLAGRLEDMALYLVETGRADLAKLALAVALHLRDGAPGLLDVSFLAGLVQKSLAFYLAQQQKKEREEPSLIVKP